MGNGGAGPGRRAGKRSPGRPASGRGRPHTRRCLDAAITVSSGHPGSAGSAERELNKELREEESEQKSTRGAGSSPVGLFLCPATPLCAPQRCPVRPGSCVGLGAGEQGVLQGMHFALVFFFYLEEREGLRIGTPVLPTPAPTFLPSSAGPVIGFSESWFSHLQNRHSTSARPWVGCWYVSWQAAAHSPHTDGETSEPQVTWDKPFPLPRALPPSFLCLCHCDPRFVGEETGARRGQSSQPVSDGFGVRFVLES